MKYTYMKKHYLKPLAFVLALILTWDYAAACTSAVISGKITPDGRPLLWKNRDTGFEQNAVKYFTSGKYPFVGVVNCDVDEPDEIWIGTNSEGFSIMNTQSYNLVKIKPGEERGAANGRVMKRALEVCATVDDFKVFLDTLAKPSLIEANFGVIDARGGAAMFEVGYHDYVMFDANNPKDAPCGYIARTNYSFSGELNKGAGYVRYMTEEKHRLRECATGAITPSWILATLARSFENGMLGIDLRSGMYNKPHTSGWFLDKDFIARESTASSVVVQGVKEGENPELTTMWTILGYPPASVVVPVWVKGGENLPVNVIRDGKTKVSPLCDRVVTLKNRVFSYSQGMGTGDYFNWEMLYNPSGTGYMQLLEPVEKEMFAITAPVLEQWRRDGRINLKQQKQLYGQADALINAKYAELFGL